MPRVTMRYERRLTVERNSRPATTPTLLMPVRPGGPPREPAAAREFRLVTGQCARRSPPPACAGPRNDRLGSAAPAGAPSGRAAAPRPAGRRDAATPAA